MKHHSATAHNEFNLISRAAQRPAMSDCFQRLFLSTVVMLAFWYACQFDDLEACIGFVDVHSLYMGSTG